VRLSLQLRHLLLASWPVDPELVERALPASLVPVEIDGESIASVVTFRCTGGRLGALPVVPFSQLNVRLYAEAEGEPAVYFVRAYVTVGGLAGAFLGAPYKPARIRVRRGRVRAPSLGIRLAYEVDAAEASPGLLGRHELGIFESAGLRSIRVARGPADWYGADLVEEPKAELLTALGLDAAGPPRLVYSPSASFSTEAPAPSWPSSSASRARR
jgi:hypothetical protein